MNEYLKNQINIIFGKCREVRVRGFVCVTNDQFLRRMRNACVDNLTITRLIDEALHDTPWGGSVNFDYDNNYNIVAICA